MYVYNCLSDVPQRFVNNGSNVADVKKNIGINRKTGDGNNHTIASRFRHLGGVDSLYGDGSVHFIKNSIALPCWRVLSSRAGGKVIGAEAF